MNKSQRLYGFTLVELIIVIAIIGILATISIIGFGRYQGDTRDARRSSSATVIAEALEKYYDLNGEYPSCSAISATTVTSSTLKNVDTGTVIAPQAATGTTNSLKCTSAGNVLATTGTDFFEYQGDGSTSCNNSGSCLSFVLKYRQEGNAGSIKTIVSRRNTAIATSGNISDLGATPIPFSTIKLAWSPVTNATSYAIQQSATNNSFPADGSLTSTTSATNATTITGLPPNTPYFYRVAPIASTGQGNWSNIVSTATLHISAPSSSSANVNSASPLSQIDYSWSGVAYASSYTIDYSTCSSFCSGVTTIAGLTSTSQSITGLAAGTPYYFRAKAIAPDDTSSYSATVSATTLQLATPGSTNANANGSNPSTQIDYSWGSVAYASSYTVDYSTCSTFCSSITTRTGITGTTISVTGLAAGTQLYFRVKAVAPNNTSSYSATVSAATYVPTPTGLSTTVNSSTQITTSWTAVAGATSYKVEYSYSSSFSPLYSTTTSSSSVPIGALLQGQYWYFRVYALIGAVSSTVSSTASSLTPIDQPAAASFNVDTTTWLSGAHHIVSYISYCPGGTSVNQGVGFRNGFGSSGFSGPNYTLNYWHSWGFSDWWDRGTNIIPAGSQVQYQSNYNCYTAYTTSPSAPTTVSYITVN